MFYILNRSTRLGQSSIVSTTLSCCIKLTKAHYVSPEQLVQHYRKMFKPNYYICVGEYTEKNLGQAKSNLSKVHL